MIWMFPYSIQSLECVIEVIYLIILHPIFSFTTNLRVREGKASLFFSHLKVVRVCFLFLKEKWQKFETLTPKVVFIDFPVGLNDLSPNWP